MELLNKCGFGNVPEEFKNVPTLSPSRLIEFMKSPRLYKHAYIDKQKKTTAAMEEGRMVHMYCLEPDKFDSHYVNPFKDIKPIKTVDDLKDYLKSNNVDFKGAKKKEDYVELALGFDQNAPIFDIVSENLRSQGKELITEDDTKMLKGIYELIEQHQWLGKAIKGGVYEQMMWYYDSDIGVIMRMKCDYFNPSLGKSKIPAIIDLKKMPDTSSDYFNPWLFKTKTYIQMAIYQECIKKITGLDAQSVIGAYDTKEPYFVEAYHIDIGAIEAGKAQFKKAGFEFMSCLEKNEWPSHGNGRLLSGTLPSWAFTKIDYDESQAVEA